MAVLDQFVQSFGSFGIRLYDLGVHIVGHGVDQVYCRTTPSHHKDVRHVGIVFLTGQVANVIDILRCGHEVNNVEFVQTVATVGYHRVAASLNGHDVIRRIGATEHAQGLVEDLGIASDFDSRSAPPTTAESSFA